MTSVFDLFSPEQAQLPSAEVPRAVLIYSGAARAVGRRVALAASACGHRCDFDDGEAGPARDGVDVVIIPPLADETTEGAVAQKRCAAAEALIEANAPDRVVLLSGIEAAGPLNADAAVAYEGDADAGPSTPWGRALHEVEQVMLETRNRLGFELVIIRPGHLFSIDDPGPLATLADALESDQAWLARHWHDGLFQPLHVDDLARAAALAVERGDWIYHLTDHSPVTVGQLVTEMAAVAGLTWSGEPRPADGPSSERCHYRYVDHRARRELSYEPVRDRAAVVESLMAPEEPDDDGDADTLSAVLRREWDDRAESEARDFYIASHAGWDEEETWSRQAALDLEFGLQGVEPAWLQEGHALEIGCGVGRLAAVLAPRVRTYTGVDVSAGMIEEARRRLKGVGHVRLLQNDGRLPEEVRDHAYRLIFAHAVFIHCPRPVIVRLVEEAAGLLEPGGYLRFDVLANPLDLEGLDDPDAAKTRTCQANEVVREQRPQDAAHHIDSTSYKGAEFRYDELTQLIERVLPTAALTIHRPDPFGFWVSVRH